MLQQRQIVKALGKQKGIENPDGLKYAITSFHYRLDTHICQRYHTQDYTITELSK